MAASQHTGFCITAPLETTNSPNVLYEDENLGTSLWIPFQWSDTWKLGTVTYEATNTFYKALQKTQLV